MVTIAVCKHNKCCFLAISCKECACSKLCSDRNKQLDFTTNKRSSRSLSWGERGRNCWSFARNSRDETLYRPSSQFNTTFTWYESCPGVKLSLWNRLKLCGSLWVGVFGKRSAHCEWQMGTNSTTAWAGTFRDIKISPASSWRDG